jgi:hypothetical protein
MVDFTAYLPCGRGQTTSSSFFTRANKLECPVHDRCDLEHKELDTVARVRWRGWPERVARMKPTPKKPRPIIKPHWPTFK